MIKEFKMLQAIDIKKKFGGNEVLKGVTVRVDRGEALSYYHFYSFFRSIL